MLNIPHHVFGGMPKLLIKPRQWQEKIAGDTGGHVADLTGTCRPMCNNDEGRLPFIDIGCAHTIDADALHARHVVLVTST